MAKMKVKRSATADLLTFDEAFKGFIEEKIADNKSPTTIANYESTYRIFCEYGGFDEDTLIDKVDSKLVYSWKAHMLADGLKPASVNHYIRDLRCILKWCMDESREYLAPFKITLVEETDEIPKHYTDDDVQLLLAKPSKRDRFTYWRCWAVFNWVMATGNRASTVCEIKLNDINFAKKEIAVRHAKGKKQQIIPLSTELAAVLKEYIRIWRSGEDVEPDAYLFANIAEEKLTPNALYRSFNNYAQDRGASKGGIHAMRHTFAKGYIKNNGNVFNLQKILGHKKLDMTRKYVALFAEDLKEGYDAVSPLDTIKRSQKRTQVVKRNND
jgi:integrase/recombinase XerD